MHIDNTHGQQQQSNRYIFFMFFFSFFLYLFKNIERRFCLFRYAVERASVSYSDVWRRRQFRHVVAPVPRRCHRHTEHPGMAEMYPSTPLYQGGGVPFLALYTGNSVLIMCATIRNLPLYLQHFKFNDSFNIKDILDK